MKIDLKQKACFLRRKGFSFREISEKLGIAKSTSAVWTRYELLSEQAKKRLKILECRGRLKSMIVIKNRQKAIWEDINKKCTVLKDKKYSISEYKIFLALLYWGEGAKKNNFNFANSDPEMVRLYLYLLRKSFNIIEQKIKVRIHLHDYHNREEMLNFWVGVTGIPKVNFSVYNKSNTGINKKPGYKGCLSIYYGDSRIRKEIFIIIERLKNFPNIAGLV